MSVVWVWWNEEWGAQTSVGWKKEGTLGLLASQPYARTYCADHLRVKLVVYLMY